MVPWAQRPGLRCMVIPPENRVVLLIERKSDREAGALAGGCVYGCGAAGFVDRDGHQEQSEALRPVAGVVVAVEAGAVVRHCKPDAVMHCRETDGQFSGARVFECVAQEAT